MRTSHECRIQRNNVHQHPKPGFFLEQPHNDFLKSRDQLSQFRETVRRLIVDIGKAHGKSTPLSIFPAMPVACAVDLGRVRMPKADGPWVIYDQNNTHGKFIRALEIGTDHEQ